MASWTPATKNSATFTVQGKTGGGGILVGNPIGLLLALTYATLPSLTWTQPSKTSAATFTTITKN